jgi:uncharacterized membrane protein YoaK (UPF0700 family)
MANRIPLEKAVLVVVLPAVAGSVNGSGLFVVGAYTSHITGTLARFGDEAAQGHWDAVRACVWGVVFFLVGAMTAAALVNRSARLARARYSAPLCLEAGLLGFVGFSSALFPTGGEGFRLLLTLVLVMAMGLQNALVTRISGAVVRTTHMTGVLTDLGIELVQLGSFLWDKVRTVRAPDTTEPGLAPARKPEVQRLMFHFTILSSFLAGALLGPVTFLRVGAVAMLLPSVVLLGLAYFDARVGFKVTERDARAWREAQKSDSTGKTTVDPDPLPAPTSLSDWKRGA